MIKSRMETKGVSVYVRVCISMLACMSVFLCMSLCVGVHSYYHK